MSTSSFSSLDWWLLGQIAVIWFYMASRAGGWLTGIALRIFTRRSPKSRLNAAVNEIFAANPLEDGQTLTLTTRDQWTVLVYKKSSPGVNHDA